MRAGSITDANVARNAQRRFCSPQCQSRVKAAAHRARKAAS
jgi:hypothetical protein